MAIVSLVFMALFVVSLVLCCIDLNMLNGSIGFVALFTGFLGISIFAVIRLSSGKIIPDEKGGNDPEGAAPEGEDANLENDGEKDGAGQDEKNALQDETALAAQATDVDKDKKTDEKNQAK